MEITLTAYLTGLPVTIETEEIDTYRGGSDYTSIYFKDDSMAMVTEDFETVDKLISGQ